MHYSNMRAQDVALRKEGVDRNKRTIEDEPLPGVVALRKEGVDRNR